jgi:hypothetical protein
VTTDNFFRLFAKAERAKLEGARCG